jgi:hypothetical protein
MLPSFSAVPLLATAMSLPDLTQPTQLQALALGFGWLLVLLVGAAIGLGLALAALNFSLKPQQEAAITRFDRWVVEYSKVVGWLPTVALVALVTVALYLGGSTLAHRYQGWEQERFGSSSNPTNAIEQVAPQIEYTASEPYTYTTQLEGKVVKVQDNRSVQRTLNPIASNLRLKLGSTNAKDVAEVNFSGEYQIKNTTNTSGLTFKMAPPQGLGLVQNFTVEKDGQRLAPSAENSYLFPVTISAGNTESVRVSYRGQGSPRWLYRPPSQLLSKLQLVIETNLANVNAIGGLLPSQVENQVNGKVLTWVLGDNAAVNQPLGAGNTFVADRFSGLVPRLLLWTPALWLWWLALLAINQPLRWRDLGASAGAVMAALAALAYASRIIRTELVLPYLLPQTLWLGLATLLLVIGVGLARQRRQAIGVALSALVAVVLPAFGLLGAYSGLILAIAGLLSLGWLATPSWYGRPRRLVAPVVTTEELHLLEQGRVEDGEVSSIASEQGLVNPPAQPKM